MRHEHDTWLRVEWLTPLQTYDGSAFHKGLAKTEFQKHFENCSQECLTKFLSKVWLKNVFRDCLPHVSCKKALVGGFAVFFEEGYWISQGWIAKVMTDKAVWKTVLQRICVFAESICQQDLTGMALVEALDVLLFKGFPHSCNMSDWCSVNHCRRWYVMINSAAAANSFLSVGTTSRRRNAGVLWPRLGSPRVGKLSAWIQTWPSRL